MARVSYHVVSRPEGKWSVRKTGDRRASRVFGNRSEAILYARSMARNSRGEMIVHGRDGMIRDHDTYGKDPVPPRGRR
jgi:hypothetical protein